MVERTARAAASSSSCSAPPPGTRRARRRRRWSTRSASTRSACSPARRYLQGEYGIDDLYMGVPVKLGAGGIEEIVELDLSDDEQQMLQASPMRSGRSWPSSRRERANVRARRRLEEAPSCPLPALRSRDEDGGRRLRRLLGRQGPASGASLAAGPRTPTRRVRLRLAIRSTSSGASAPASSAFSSRVAGEPWISGSTARTAIVCGASQGSGSRSPRRSPRRARTSPCSRGGARCSSARPSGSARLAVRGDVTEPAGPASGSSSGRSRPSAASTSS